MLGVNGCVQGKGSLTVLPFPLAQASGGGRLWPLATLYRECEASANEAE